MKTVMLRSFCVLGCMFLFQGCGSEYAEMLPGAKQTIYPCTIGCGDERITPPKGYVYYQRRVMSLDEFNRLTGQNIVMQ